VPATQRASTDHHEGLSNRRSLKDLFHLFVRTGDDVRGDHFADTARGRSAGIGAK
jgi:hypothetical protein